VRPTYETPADIEREREVIDMVASKAGMTAHKLKAYSNVDFALMKDRVVRMVCEVKVRNKLYPQMMLSLDKVQALRNYAAMGLEARVIYATPEGIYVKKVGPDAIDGWIGMGGRTDRDDPDDTEMVVYFGQMTVNGKRISEEKDPMKRVCDSERRWFE
jgi:hypothetical protein